MKVKIQRTDETITLQEMVPSDDTKEVLKKDLAKIDKDFFDLAQRFFECFPKFREVVFNTELTSDEQTYN